MAGATSAAHVLALLDEDEDSLKLYALQQLDRSGHDFWFQISSSIAAIEALYEDEDFSHRELAALVASKVRSPPIDAPHRPRQAWTEALAGSAGRQRRQALQGCRRHPPPLPPTRNRPLLLAPSTCPDPDSQVFYHLGDLDDALTYALGAGSLFDVNSSAEYVQTILGEWRRRSEKQQQRQRHSLVPFRASCILRAAELVGGSMLHAASADVSVSSGCCGGGSVQPCAPPLLPSAVLTHPSRSALHRHLCGAAGEGGGGRGCQPGWPAGGDRGAAV